MDNHFDHMKNGCKLVLWYTEPATAWETEVLPIGNSYLGATIDGGMKEETIVLNEKTLWTGGPSKSRPDYRGGNRNEASYKYLYEIRKALSEGAQSKAASLVQKLTGISEGYGAYQLFGNLVFQYENINPMKVCNYRRWLDIESSTAGVEFICDGVRYEREYFANYPSNVIVIKLQAENNSLSFTASLKKTQPGAVICVSGDTLICSGAIEDNGLRYEGQFVFHTTGGKLTSKKDAITVTNANKVMIYLSAATDYRNIYPTYRSKKNPHDLVSAALTAAVDKGYDLLLSEHVTDYQSLSRRVDIWLGGDFATPATDICLSNYKNRLSSELVSPDDRYLEILYFQYGRYLLISSSRTGTLPANLQGVWNESNTPPWSCDYHINVNLQMNYWPAHVTNLTETSIPLVDYIEGLREPGRVTAKEYYGITSDEEHPENGWIAHTQSTPFGFTCPGWDFYWGWSSAACAWLDQNLWEYYEFTGDKQYLRNKIYPIMRENVTFFIQELIYDQNQKRLVSSPSFSPEHGPVTIGNTYEQSLIEQLFRDFITASEILDEDETIRHKAEVVLRDLNPYRVSKKTGLLMEWFEEDEESFDFSQVDPHHRHTSHLLGLYPGKGITHGTPELMKAAEASLNARGDEATGWGRAIKALMWARIGDGERAYKLLTGLLKDCTNDNLWDECPPFQIDGNFGGTAAIAEMLIQSHMGYISILPALPKVWSKGSFRGLCARGGFVVDAEWMDGKLTKLTLLSKNGGSCSIKGEKAFITDGDGKNIAYQTQDTIVTFQTKSMESYHITFDYT